MKWLLPFLLGFTLMIAFQGTVRGQHPHEHQHLHEEFYKTWKVPATGSNHRIGSCCNNKDCYPTQTKFEHNKWWFLHRESNSWIVIPDGRLEHNQPDPRESPDGQSHICANSFGRVICAAVGSGI